MNLSVSLSELNGSEGYTLSETIYDDSGSKILISEGKELDESMVNLLKKYFSKRTHSIEKIMIPVHLQLEKNGLGVDDSVNEELKSNTLQALKKTYISSEKDLSNSLTEIKKLVREIVSCIQKSPKISYSLDQYRIVQTMPNVFEHSLRVAQFSIALANIYNSHIAENEGKISLESVGVAALLHDFGIRYQNPNEMKKLYFMELNDAFFQFYPMVDFNVLQQPYQEKYKNIYAYAALEPFLDYSTRTMLLLSGKSEKEKTEISPKISKANATTLGAKIIYLCNLYDSLLFNTIKEDISLENVSALIGQLVENQVVNKELGNLLLKEIPLYSIGEHVLLSNGEHATVTKSFTGTDTTKPIVKTVGNSSSPSRVIDLRNTTNITILKIVSPSQKVSDIINQIGINQINSINISDQPEQMKEVGRRR